MPNKQNKQLLISHSNQLKQKKNM